MPDEVIQPPTKSDNNLASVLSYVGKKTRVKFYGSCLEQDKITFSHGEIVNIYTVCEISVSNHRYDDYPLLESCLSSAVNLTKNSDINKYKCSGSGIGFDRGGNFSFRTWRFGCNVIVFGVDMSSSVHVDNKKIDIIILGEYHTEGLDATSLTFWKKVFN